jgi:hypothetical protein
MFAIWRDFWIRETGTGQQVAELHDRYMMMMMMTTTNFLVAFSISKALSSGSKGSVVYIYVCLTSSTPCTFNNREMFPPPKKNVGVCNQIILLIPYYINIRLVTVLKTIDVPLQVSAIFDLTFRFKFIICSFEIFLIFFPEIQSSFTS